MPQGTENIIDGMDPVKAYSMGMKTGIKEGIRKYAWWRDGVQYVGTTGRTLKEALDEIDKEIF